MDDILRIDDLDVSYGEKPLLRSIDLAIAPAETYALMGPGGAGKSTLLNTIARPREEMSGFTIDGAITYDGGDLGPDHRPALIGQSLGLFSSTLFEYLATADPRRSEMTRRELRERYRDQLDRYGIGGLGERLDEEIVTFDRTDQVPLAILRTTLRQPALVCLDEPMAGMEPEEAEVVVGMLERMHRAGMQVLIVTHHQKRARLVADRVGLLAGGRIHEVAPADTFFDNPQTEEGRRYVRTGHCNVPSLNANPEEIADDYEAEEEPTEDVSLEGRRKAYQQRRTSKQPLESADQFRPESQGPRGFYWVVDGRLGGTPRPGGVRPIEQDLAALERLELTTLVTLKLDKLQTPEVEASDLEVLHFPIVDMKTPELEAAAEFIAELTERLAAGERVALHCEAGIGRTGTMLACYLVYHGLGGREALDEVRSVYHRYVQSEEQEEFLVEFEEYLA